MLISNKNYFYYILFWLYVLLVNSTAYSQSYFTDYQNLDKQIKNSQRDFLTDSLINLAITKQAYKEAVKIAHKHSIEKYKIQDYEGAIAYGFVEIEILDKNNLDRNEYVQALYNVGRFYYKNDEFERAEFMHQKIVELNHSNQTKGRSYCEIGRSYFAKGDYYKAVDFYRFGIAALEKTIDPITTIRSLVQLSNIYEQINTSESLQEKYNVLTRALELSKEASLPKLDQYALYSSLASYFHNDETYDFQKAKLYMNKSLEIALASKDDKNTANLYSNLGNLYDSAKKDSAYYFYKKALTYYKDEGEAIRTFNNLASFHLKRNQYQKAIVESHKTISYVSGIDDYSERIPTIGSLLNTSDKYSVLRALLLKSTAYLGMHDHTNDPIFIQKAFINLKIADEVIDFLLKESTEVESKFHWRKTASDIYAKLIHCTYLMKDRNLFFQYAEKNKAFLLTTSVLENAEKKQLPDSILPIDLQFRKKIATAQKGLNELLNSEKKDAMERDLFQLKEAYRSFQDTLEKNFPSHFLSKNQGKVFKLTDIQKTLDTTKLLVSITWNESDEFSSNAYVFLVSQTETRAYLINDLPHLKKVVLRYREAISSPFRTKEDRSNFIDLSNELYRILFPTEDILTFIKNKHLVIIPDGHMQSIPFESLITIKEPPTYLIQQHEISYTYSASFQLHNESITRMASKGFVAFSPVTFSDTSLDSLTYSKQEMENVEKHIKGDFYFRRDATKSQFLKNYGNYQIVHLATHANASGNPWITFNDATVSLTELYTAPNNAELVVLSSCNTAVGKLHEGEGVLSLERGFFYSGAHAVISSLWNVNDKSATTILGDFYKNLATGMSKSQSLRNAKLDYLNSHTLSQTSPYYWAPYILVGNTDPVSYHPETSKLTWLWGIAFFVVIFLLIKKK